MRYMRSHPLEPPDSPENLRNMHLITTLGLTHPEGYVAMHHHPSHLAGEPKFWYPSWDVDRVAVANTFYSKARKYVDTHW